MSARLLVLGILQQGPLHGYEIRKVIEQNGMDAWSGVLPGSIYHALHQMEREGLVVLEGTEQTGNRMRAVYAISDKGRAEFGALLRKTWSEPASALPTGLYLGLAFLEKLPQAEVIAALDRQIEALDAMRRHWVESRPLKGPMPPHLELTYDNGIEHIEADLRLARRLRQMLTGNA
jgi:DNA-binding PadR family transcriptional regulator